MRTLLIGIAAIALLALPASAVELDDAQVDVVINVSPYGAIELGTDVTVDVLAAYKAGTGYLDSVDFMVVCNCPTQLNVTPAAGEITASTYDTAGQLKPKGYAYPTAFLDGNPTDPEDGLGYSATVSNLTTALSAVWGSQGADAFVGITVDFDPTLKAEYVAGNNARITINADMESTRGPNKLAPKGTYTGTLILTLSTNP